MAWHPGNHFSLFILPAKADTGPFKAAAQTLHSRFPDALLPRPENFEFPIRICSFPFPDAVEGEPYSDTLEKQLGDYYAHARLGGYPVRQVRLKPQQFHLEGDCIFLTLTPVTVHDERRLVQITDRICSRFACEICPPAVLFAQLRPGFSPSPDLTNALKEIFTMLDCEASADMHSLSLVLRYSATAADTRHNP